MPGPGFTLPCVLTAQGAPPVTAKLLDAAALMDWAQRQIPQVFPNHASTVSADRHVYRKSPTTQNLIAVKSEGEVYVLGPVTANQLKAATPYRVKQLLYADGTSTGQTDRVDFEDWEAQGTARNVIFVWPNCVPLNDTAEGYIDDFHFLAPTGSLELQVMYLAITKGTEVPLGAAAVLLNP